MCEQVYTYKHVSLYLNVYVNLYVYVHIWLGWIGMERDMYVYMYEITDMYI